MSGGGSVAHVGEYRPVNTPHMAALSALGIHTEWASGPGQAHRLDSGPTTNEADRLMDFFRVCQCPTNEPISPAHGQGALPSRE